MRDPVFVGIDFGTSSIKICLFNEKGRLLREESAVIYPEKPEPNFAELNLADVRDKMLKTLKSCACGYETRIASLAFSVTCPTLVLFDSKLQPLRRGVLYLDNRAEAEVSEITASFGGREAYFNRVGNVPSPSTCLSGILHWLKKHEPETLAATYKIGYLNSYMASVLTGKLAADPTCVSYSGLATVKDPYRWDLELLKAMEIDENILPEILPCFSQAGTLTGDMAEILNLPAGIPVAIGSADSAAAGLALGLKKHGDSYDNIGTSEVLGVCLDKPAPHIAFMNRCHVIPGLWLAQGALSASGASIRWLHESVFPELPNPELLEAEALKSDAGAGGVIYLPYIAGERSPIFDPNTCGVFFGLSVNTDKADMIRAVYEGPGYGIRQLYSLAKDAWQIKPDFIRAVGGASRSRLVLQIRSDVTNLPYRMMEVANASAYGAAMLGAVAAGYMSVDQIPVCNVLPDVIEPDADRHLIYDRNFRLYESLYPALGDLMHRQKSGV